MTAVMTETLTAAVRASGLRLVAGVLGGLGHRRPEVGADVEQDGLHAPGLAGDLVVGGLQQRARASGAAPS
ncbi:hypothetical protein ACOBQX_26685 [Actinokineospora sp. G85]|uniref:hypothetical protein n=1 Tax=Actinokineospora sp. G85 TaxID=3406626 RepID=UPI003C776B3F